MGLAHATFSFKSLRFYFGGLHMKKLRIGIAGLGRLGKVHANNIAYKIPNAELVAACSIVEAELEYAKKELGVTEDMIDGIADATFLFDGGYKALTRDEVVEIVKESL
jgi:predicted dehydrogenase